MFDNPNIKKQIKNYEKELISINAGRAKVREEYKSWIIGQISCLRQKLEARKIGRDKNKKQYKKKFKS